MCTRSHCISQGMARQGSYFARGWTSETHVYVQSAPGALTPARSSLPPLPITGEGCALAVLVRGGGGAHSAGAALRRVPPPPGPLPRLRGRRAGEGENCPSGPIDPVGARFSARVSRACTVPAPLETASAVFPVVPAGGFSPRRLGPGDSSLPPAPAGPGCPPPAPTPPAQTCEGRFPAVVAAVSTADAHFPPSVHTVHFRKLTFSRRSGAFSARSWLRYMPVVDGSDLP
jgi:hypothetical protein